MNLRAACRDDPDPALSDLASSRALTLSRGFHTWVPSAPPQHKQPRVTLADFCAALPVGRQNEWLTRRAANHPRRTTSLRRGDEIACTGSFNRGSPEQHENMARWWLVEGRTVVIFPQGFRRHTRIHPGRRHHPCCFVAKCCWSQNRTTTGSVGQLLVCAGEKSHVCDDFRHAGMAFTRPPLEFHPKLLV